MSAELVVGRFYWVMPAIDVDSDAQWESEMQPARYAGKNANGNLLWNCMGLDGASDWHMRWIGPEITPTPPKTISVNYQGANGQTQGYQVPDGQWAAFSMLDGASVSVSQGDKGIAVEIKAAQPMYVEPGEFDYDD